MKARQQIKYIDVWRGEMRIALHPDGTASISGGATDPDMQRYQAIDGLRVRIGELNEQLADCIAATAGLIGPLENGPAMGQQANKSGTMREEPPVHPAP